MVDDAMSPSAAGWEPAVPLAERIMWALFLGGLPWLAAIGRFDLFALVFASVWSALIVAGCVWGIVRDTKAGVKW